VFDAHFPEGPDGALVAVVNAPGSAEGLDARGDSVWFNPGETVTVQVSAPEDTSLFFVCLLHPWMSGEIRVR
jgi:hypothetical protein